MQNALTNNEKVLPVEDTPNFRMARRMCFDARMQYLKDKDPSHGKILALENEVNVRATPETIATLTKIGLMTHPQAAPRPYISLSGL